MGTYRLTRSAKNRLYKITMTDVSSRVPSKFIVASYVRYADQMYSVKQITHLADTVNKVYD